jgi:hypothetical protein
VGAMKPGPISDLQGNESISGYRGNIQTLAGTDDTNILRSHDTTVLN